MENRIIMLGHATVKEERERVCVREKERKESLRDRGSRERERERERARERECVCVYVYHFPEIFCGVMMMTTQTLDEIIYFDNFFLQLFNRYVIVVVVDGVDSLQSRANKRTHSIAAALIIMSVKQHINGVLNAHSNKPPSSY